MHFDFKEFDPGSAAMAVRTAREFRRNVKVIFDQVPANKDLAAAHFGANTDLMIFSATNLIFAAELFLKSLYLVIGLKPPQNHNLWKLYTGLPKKLQEIIEGNFGAKFAALENKASLHIVHARAQLSQEEFESAVSSERKPVKPNASGSNTGLRQALKETGDSYQAWRYLFQGLNNGRRQQVLHLHWPHLDCFCGVVDDIILNAQKQFAEQHRLD
nr:HEPN domain-containing protein [uncultured Ruegeria sp.]